MAPTDTARSWNAATALYNAHKGDQAEFLGGGGDAVSPEELELLGPVAGLDLVHLQCNSGQDTLCLARRGATTTGGDFSEVVAWMQATDARLDLAFASYGALPWIRDLDAWMAGVARILRPGGRLVVLEFHPLVWSLGDAFDLKGDDYFCPGPYVAPVGDYVGNALGESLGDNQIPATAWQHTVAEMVGAALRSGLRLAQLREYAHCNFARLSAALVAGPARTWRVPDGIAGIPLMVGLVAVLPDADGADVGG